jgi:hypothetical protein
VIPKLDLVVAQKVIHVAKEEVNVLVYRKLVNLIVSARAEE